MSKITIHGIHGLILQQLHRTRNQHFHRGNRSSKSANTVLFDAYNRLVIPTSNRSNHFSSKILYL